MALGVIFGETSTREFSFLFGDPQGQGQHQLKYAYVQVALDNENRVVARVVDVNTENPLLGRDTAKVLFGKRSYRNTVSGLDVTAIHIVSS